MNDTQMDDLKDFMATLIGQTELNLGQRIDKLDAKIDTIREEVNGGFAAVGETVDGIIKRLDARDDKDTEVDKRLTKLENHVALAR